MKKLFKAIRKNNFEEVKQLIEKNPEIVNVPFEGTPIKDDGQSPLQVALKTGKLDIADYLIEHDADVNFIDTNSVNKWKSPVIHDAIRCAIMNSRWNVYYKYNNETKVVSTKKNADKSYSILEKIISKGADINVKDSFQNTCLDIFAINSNQILPNYNAIKKTISNDRIITDEIKEDLSRILKLLIDSGWDVNVVNHNTNKSFKEEFYNGILCKCITLDI